MHGMLISRGRLFCFALAGVFLAAAVWAQQPWRAKPPEKWTKKEAKKILSDSPWAQPAMMPYHLYVAAGGGYERTDRTPAGRTPYPTNPDDATNPAQKSWDLIVIWSSSKTVRRAVTRESADTYTPDPEDEKLRRMYEITVISASNTYPLPEWSESDLKSSTWLKFGPDGKEISPERVQVERTGSVYRAESYTFRFPREDEEGRPLLRPDVKEILFECRLGPVGMHAKFEPAKMVAHDGPDI